MSKIINTFENLKRKNMEIKYVEKMTRIYSRIKEIDVEMLEIERNALEIANDDCTIIFELSITNKTKEAEDKKKNLFDADGSLVADQTSQSFGFYGWLQGGKPEKEADTATSKICKAVSPAIALQQLGCYLNSLSAERFELIKLLRKYNVNI